MVRVKSHLQQKILELLKDVKDGLTLEEIQEGIESPGVSAEDLRGCLQSSIVWDYLESPKTDKEKRWLITQEGLRAIGAINDHGWP